MNTNPHESVVADVRRLTSENKQSLVTSAATRENWTRRNFLRDGARYGLLVGIAAIMARVTTRKLSPESQKCVNQGICRPCGKFPACGLPQALSVRAVLKGGNS